MKHFKLTWEKHLWIKWSIRRLGDEEGADNVILPHKNDVSFIYMLPCGISVSLKIWIYQSSQNFLKI